MGTRIVICDDHPVFRRGLAAALDAEPDLELAGEVGTLAELHDLLHDRSAAGPPGPDLVLLDVELPDGLAVDHLLELVPLVGVVMVSAHDAPELVRSALKAGALGYLRKDAEPEDVLRLVRRAAQGKTALSGDMALRLAEALRPQPQLPPLAEVLQALSPRQRDVLALVAEGRSNREIADQLFLSEGTVKNHVSSLLEAAGVADRTKLAVLYVRHHQDGSLRWPC